jgi:hypothetical protein
MDETDLRRLLLMMAQERLPVDISGQNLKFTGVPQMPESAPQELQSIASQFARLGAKQETGQARRQLTYENLLGGLLGVKGEVGENYKKGSIGFSPTPNVDVSATMSQDQFGNLMRSLQAQYIKKLNEDLMLGLMGRVGSNPYVGLQMMGRF